MARFSKQLMRVTFIKTPDRRHGSQRSVATENAFTVDIILGPDIIQIARGARSHIERLSMYNQLLCINIQLCDKAEYTEDISPLS